MSDELTESELDRQVAQCRLADASSGLRDKVLTAATAEWPVEPTLELRAQVLAAAETEWNRPVETAETISWRVSLGYLAASVAAAVVLIFVATVANDRVLAQWQNPQTPAGAMPGTNEPSQEQMVAAPAFAALRQAGPSKDFLRQLLRSRAMLNNHEGERI